MADGGILMGNVISIINMKGGVGKTTLSLGISDYLAETGSKVLLIDIDPQFNATQAMLTFYKKSEYESDDYYNDKILNNHRTIYQLFKMQTNLSDESKTPKADDLIITLSNNLDLLCGDLNLILVNKSSDHSFVMRLKNFIDDNNLRNKYDYIIIDCPPTMTIYTDSALMASDFYLIPNRIDRYSIVGIELLQKVISNLITEERIKLKCIGLIYTMVKKDSAKQEKLRINFESKKADEIEIFSSYTSMVNNVSLGAQGPIPTKYKSSKQDIEAIVEEMKNKINIDVSEG